MKTKKTNSLLGRSSALLAVPIGLLTSFHASTFAAWPSASFSCLGDPVEAIGPVSAAGEDTQALQVLRSAGETQDAPLGVPSAEFPVPS